MKQKESFPSILIRIKTNNFLTVKLKKFKCMDKIRIEKNIKYQKINIAKNIAIFKNVLPKICYTLDKHLPIFWKATLSNCQYAA